MCNDYKKITKSQGILYGVGIGPGDPDLLTLKAKKILGKVDIIFAPKPNIKSSSIAKDIIKNHVQKSRVKELVFPMTRDKKRLKKFWKEAASKVYKKLSSEKDVAFITIGDPFIYSTYIYLLYHIRELDKNLKIITIPGISAINGASALLEVPLAYGDERFAVMPLPGNLQELKDILAQFDTVVLLKIGKDLGKLINFLKKEGLEKFSFFARRIGTPAQYIVRDLSSLNEKTSGYLSIVIIRSQRIKKRKQ